MLSFLNFIRTGELTLLSIVIRLVLAVLCGGCIGLERERKHRPAGFRTHILICLGASMTTLTSNYLITQQLTTDPARLGAQVIAGIGFIDAVDYRTQRGAFRIFNVHIKRAGIRNNQILQTGKQQLGKQNNDGGKYGTLYKTRTATKSHNG